MKSLLSWRLPVRLPFHLSLCLSTLPLAVAAAAAPLPVGGPAASAVVAPTAASGASAPRQSVRLPMPAVAGTYQLVQGQSRMTEDPSVQRLVKGKLVVESIDATHLRVLEARTIQGVGTRDQMDVYLWTGDHFIMISPFEPEEVEVAGLEQFTLKGDTLVRRVTGFNFVEDTRWKRVSTLDVYDRWVERALEKARVQCQNSTHCVGASAAH